MRGPAGADFGSGADERRTFDAIQDQDLVPDQDLQGSRLAGIADERLELGPGGRHQIIGPERQRAHGDCLVPETPAVGERAAGDHALGLERGEQPIGRRLVQPRGAGQVRQAPLGTRVAEDLEQRHRAADGLGPRVGLRARSADGHGLSGRPVMAARLLDGGGGCSLDSVHIMN